MPEYKTHLDLVDHVERIGPSFISIVDSNKSSHYTGRIPGSTCERIAEIGTWVGNRLDVSS